jgi:hypothetical protein
MIYNSRIGAATDLSCAVHFLIRKVKEMNRVGNPSFLWPAHKKDRTYHHGRDL